MFTTATLLRLIRSEIAQETARSISISLNIFLIVLVVGTYAMTTLIPLYALSNLFKGFFL